MENFTLMFGDNEDTWSGGDFDTLEQASEVGKGFDRGYATGYQIYDDNGDIVEEDYIEDDDDVAEEDYFGCFDESEGED